MAIDNFKMFGGSSDEKPENKAGRDKVIYDLNTKTTKVGYDRLQKYLSNKEIKDVLSNFPTRISKIPITVKNKMVEVNNSRYIPSFSNEEVVEFIKEHYKEGQSRYVNEKRWLKFVIEYKKKYTKDFDASVLKTPEVISKFPGENGILSILNSFLRKRYGLTDKNELIMKNRNRIEKLRDESENKAYENTKEKAVITLEELRELYDFALKRFNDMRSKIPKGSKIIREEYEAMVLFGIYAYVNAFRDDLGSVILLPQKGLSVDIHKENIYDLTTHRLYLRSFKTQKSHGELKYQIPSKIGDIIDEMMKEYPYKRLLIGVELSDAKSRGDDLSSYIKKISNLNGKTFSKAIRINIIRQAWATAGKEESYTERKELAKKMGHSVLQADSVYVRRVEE